MLPYEDAVVHVDCHDVKLQLVSDGADSWVHLLLLEAHVDEPIAEQRIPRSRGFANFVESLLESVD